MRLSIYFIGLVACHFLHAVIFAQETPKAPAPASPPAAGSSDSQTVTRAELKELLGKFKEELLEAIKPPPLATSAGQPAPAAGVAPPAPGAAAPGAAATPADEAPPAPATGPVVAKEFWSIDTAKDTGIYSSNEPSILEAVHIVSDQFKEAATLITNSPPEKAASIFVGRKKLIVSALTGKGGRDDTMTKVWGNFCNAWQKEVIKKSNPLQGDEKKKLLAKAFEEASGEILELGTAINTAQDEGAEKGALGNGTNSRGSMSGGGGGSYGGTGYLPPWAAWHHARHVRRSAVLQARINLYGGR